MFDYLVTREQDEMFRTSARDLKFPDGETRRIETFRLVWSWFDRAIAYTYGPSENDILTMALRCADHENRTLDEALGRVLDYIIRDDESQGLDYTDDNIELLIAKQAMDRFQERKRKT